LAFKSFDQPLESFHLQVQNTCETFPKNISFLLKKLLLPLYLFLKTQNKGGKKKEINKIHRNKKNINLFSQTLMKCTNDEIMVHHPKHDGGAISHVMYAWCFV
jgi:hypothetical protein